MTEAISASREPTPLELPRLPVGSLKFRQNSRVAAWLLDMWERQFGDGNELADWLCGPVDSGGLTFPGDVDELLRALRDRGWLKQLGWTAHLSDFGCSREAWLGVQQVFRKNQDTENCRFYASAYGFEPVRCDEFFAYVGSLRGLQPHLPKREQYKGPGDVRIGDRLKYTDAFLRSCGMHRDRTMRDEVFTVRECQCKNGHTIAVDAPRDTSYWTAEELAARPCLRFLHVHKSNLRRVK